MSSTSLFEGGASLDKWLSVRLRTKWLWVRIPLLLVLVFKKMESEDKTNYDTFYSHSKAEKIINESDIDDIFKSIYTVDRLILINI